MVEKNVSVVHFDAFWTGISAMRFRQASLAAVKAWLLLCHLIGMAMSVRRGADQLVTRDDLLVSLHTSHDRLSLVRASRAWRRGVRTVITSDQKPTSQNTPPGLLDGTGRHREIWRAFKDIGNSDLALGPRSGDLRAAMAPFIANNTVGNDGYKWILYGDDDTVFNIDNVLRLVNQLDHNNPYLLTDCLWFPDNITGDMKLHPNREAPRCLPCELDDPLLEPGALADCVTAVNSTKSGAQFAAPRTCTCTRAALCHADNWNTFNKSTCDTEFPEFQIYPGEAKYPHAGWWYMLHGGAGALISSGLMRRSTFDVIKDFYIKSAPQSGDAMITRAIWNVMGIGPTDPGYGYCRPHVQMFDPGWRGFRARGAEDLFTGDGGADPTGVVARMELLLNGKCGAVCEDQLHHLISVHVRGKYAAADFLGGDTDMQQAEDMQPHFRAAVHLMHKLGKLFDRLALRRREIDNPRAANSRPSRGKRRAAPEVAGMVLP